MMLPNFLKNLIPNFEIIDLKEWKTKGRIDIYLEKKKKSPKKTCCRCGSELHGTRGKHRLMLEHMPIFNFKVYLH